MTLNLPATTSLRRVILLGLVFALVGVLVPSTARAQQVDETQDTQTGQEIPADPPVEPAPKDEPPADEQPAEEPPAQDPNDEGTADESPVDEQPPADEEPVEQPPAQDPNDEGTTDTPPPDPGPIEVAPGGLGGIFAPGTDPNYVDEVLDGLNDPIGQARSQFDENRRWNPLNTALNNGGFSQGDALELTWSIIPDGTSMPAAGPWDTACNSNLIASFDAAFGAGQWQAEFQRVWDDWTAKTGNVYTPAVALDGNGTPIDDGANWPTSGGVAGVRGDIRIGGCTIDGDSGTLAYNYYPLGSAAGDMKLDAVDRFYEITTLSPGLHNVFSHEHGHGTGLRHVCPVNQTKLLEPFISTAYTGLQHDDLRGIQRGYGDKYELINNPNDSSAAATVVAPIGGLTEEDLSLDSTTDVDWFQFPGLVDGKLDVTLTPSGFSYLEGPVVNDSCNGVAGTLLDSASIMDLSFEIRDDTGVLTTIDTTTAGAAEALANFTLTHAGTHYIRVSGTGTDDTQLYDLSVALTAAPSGSVCPAEMLIGEIGYGVAARDGATGSGYLMWSAQPVRDRFNPDPYFFNADHVIAVVYNNGWYYDNNSVLTPFDPAADDCLIAAIDFSADTAETLRGTSQIINGIDSGYTTGDLEVFANQLNGNPNTGEFDLTGTIIGDDVTPAFPPPTSTQCPAEMLLGDTKFGVAARDNATGTGYLMWSEQQVRDRFNPDPYFFNADHVIAVVYNNGWYYDNNSRLTAFDPASTDCLIAAIDFSADTATTLVGTSAVINGIDSGYTTGDLAVFANQLNGNPNNGEFDFTGTIIGD